MNMFRNNFISKLDGHDDDTRLVIKETIAFFQVKGERFEDRVRLDWPSLPFLRIFCSVSVNGTLCLCKDYGYYMTTVLWNPDTREFKFIPPPTQPLENIELNSPPLGFCYDHVTDDYKVIRSIHYRVHISGSWVYVPEKDDPFWETNVNDPYWELKEVDVQQYDPFCEIYSLISNSWRKLQWG